MVGGSSLTARWPERICELARVLHQRASDLEFQRARDDLWVVLSAALDHGLAVHQPHLGAVTREVREDLVSEKASDLAIKIEEDRWRPEDEMPSRVAGFVMATARNGLVDHLRKHGALRAEPEGAGESFDFERLVADPRTSPMTQVLSGDFVEALLTCIERLGERERRAWELRVMHELSTKEIANHPDVQLSVANVDVILYRLRQRVRACMADKGMEAIVPPPGTWARLWARLRDARKGEWK